MARLADLAERHRASQEGVTRAAVSRALRVWQRFDLAELDLSWSAQAPGLVASVSEAQRRVAAQSNPYVAAVQRGEVRSRVAPEAFSGVTLDGRELGPAMYGAVTHTKKLIGAGRPAFEAFLAGASFLAAVVGSAVQDMGRQADLTAGVGAGRRHYVRVIQPGACSRCAILAGKWSSDEVYLRHPSCKCSVLPVRGGERVPAGMFDTAGAYFESLSPAEQDRVFTKAGAEAIRQGADPMKVVNARRGAYGIGYSGHYGTFISESGMRRLKPVTIGVKPDGSPLQVFMTSEGTTARGVFGRREIAEFQNAQRDGRYRRTTTIRLMPEQIAVMAGGDPDRWVSLLKRYGYLY